MAEKIDKKTFKHLVDLAALALEAEEAEYLRRELNNQLGAIRELEAITVDPGTPATSHGVPYNDAISRDLREDNWIACPNPEEILAQAPELEDGHIVVPDIPHEDL